ncbi:uncharacterized protein LOC115874439 [Sitophilus oryzae]|uniref:Uncharacterized protein LOC115874439 n=1 Tax=Sitophilus oryzae TaxID=7048 RepID=A0A6J2X2K1_SITOR|nr:uncharacterized protein LOC115874439 [Sitophilus oryzae]
MKIYVFFAVLLSLSFTITSADLSDYETSNQEDLDPLNDPDQDTTDNDQDKRTICSALSGLRCGAKFSKLIKYKFRPAYSYARPVLVRPVGYKYSKPKNPLTLPALKPSASGGWRPIIKPTKPIAVPVFKPPGHVDVIHNNPVPHVDHIQSGGTPGHIHLQPGHVHLQPNPVHFHPVAVQGAHIDQIHQIQVPHGNHYDTFAHIDHLHQVPTAPLVPVAPVAAPVRPLVPSPVLFEVTKPNLGVLPLGARFHTPILRELPHHLHLRPFAPVPVAPPAVPVPVPVRPAAVPIAAPVVPAQSVVPAHIGLPHIAPQPGVSVEYHGTRNYLPSFGAVPHLHALPAGPSLPFPHAHHGFAAQQQQELPHDHQAHFLQQPLPLEGNHQFLQQNQVQQLQQQLPYEENAHYLQQNQAHRLQQFQQQYTDIPQQQLPLEGEQEQYLNNNINLQNFDQNNVIQPGQTDLQIPYHLPQHHQGFDGSAYQQTEESRGFNDQVFRPSPALEPPYVK